MKTLFFCIIALLPFSLNAAMYKWVDENGEIVYSDEPPHEGAEEIKPPKLTTTPAVKYKPSPKPEPEKKEAFSYTALSVTSPTKAEHIRDNAGNIAVSIAINPALNTAEGHYLSLQVNGRTVMPRFTSTSTTINNADRGANAISVAVHDKTGKILKSSDGVTVYVHRHSKLHNQPKPPPPPPVKTTN